MKQKLLLFLAFGAMAGLLSAQQNMYVWKGKHYTEFLISSVDSITFVDVWPEPEPLPECLEGVFSVAEGKTIKFSRGNLQYTQSTETWSFAEQQYYCIGAANVENGALADKIDLFGWSGSTGTAQWGISISTNYTDYSGDFVDWGLNIGDGETWRTLTYDEWEFLLNMRSNADKLIGVAQIDLGVEKYANGLILLPDNWQAPDGITFKSGFSDTWTVAAYGEYQTFTATEWQQLENAGAVFLPASGYRASDAINVGYIGRYWSATSGNVYDARSLSFYSDEADMYNDLRDFGLSVRLVQDMPEPEPEPEPLPECLEGVFSIAEGKTIKFSRGNLQYTQSTDTWSLAEQQYDFIGTDNVTGGTVSSDATYGDSKSGTALADKIDLFGWSGYTGAAWGIGTSSSSSDYSGDFKDWGYNIGDGTTWRTLSIDEWAYLFETRANASSLYGVARINLNEDGSDFANGMILLPDDWQAPDGIVFNSGFAANNSSVDAYGDNQTFTLADWQRMEAAGAVFLPASSYRNGTTMGYVGYYGYYYSTTPFGSSYVKCLRFTSSEMSKDAFSRYLGRSVRLVQAAERVPDPDEPFFTVSGDWKKVSFASGNLQYTQSTQTWSFAEHQYDFIGAANVENGVLADKIDWFCWSGSTGTQWGIGASSSTSGYSGDFVDWGQNVGDGETWRTLTYDEWYYMVNMRINAEDLIGVAMIDLGDELYANGLILLPDKWQAPDGITFKPGFSGTYSAAAYGEYQTFTAAEWQQLENAGAVFLPASGERYGTDVYSVGVQGYYWSATPTGNQAYGFQFWSKQEQMVYGSRGYSYSVRLVRNL